MTNNILTSIMVVVLIITLISIANAQMDSCDAYWEGYVFDTENQKCKLTGASGCSNPFEFETKTACENANLPPKSCPSGCICNGDTLTCPTEQEPTIATEILTTPKNNNTKALSSEHISDKIITHGYNLIDEYIKENQNKTTFPGGIFFFRLNNDIDVGISPALINGKIWRIISFNYPDGASEAIILDGPIYQDPGTRNEDAIKNAKETLSNILDETKKIKMILRENISLDLEENEGFSFLIAKMFKSINVSIESPIEDANATITISKTGTGKTSIQNGEVEVVTSEKVFVINSRLTMQTSFGSSKEIKVMPEEISEILGMSFIETAELEEELEKAIYSVSGTKKARLFFIFPLDLDIEAKVDAETGVIISLEKPWWSFLAFGI